MIEMKVMGIALDVRTNSPIVVLHDLYNRKALPIWIGSAEASAIIRCIEGLVVARPMTHDLITNIIEKTGQKLDKIEINDVEKETYYATLFLSKDGETLEIDARPSDAIAVAMRAEAPIFVTANVLMNGSVSTDAAKDEEEAQNPNLVKCVFDVNNYAMYFSRSKIPYERNAGKSKIYGHLGIYGYKREALFKMTKLLQTSYEQAESLEQLRALQNGMKIKVAVVDNIPVGIDTLEDFEKFKRMVEAQ